MSLPPELMNGLAPAEVMPSGPLPPGGPSMAGTMPVAIPPGMMPPPPPQRQPNILPARIGEAIARAMNQKKNTLAKALAENMGKARGLVNADDKTILSLWRKQNIYVDPVALHMSGVPADEILDRTYPFRRTLIKLGRVTLTEQVEFAEKMLKLDNDPRYADLEDIITQDAELPEAEYPSEDGMQPEPAPEEDNEEEA